MFQIAAVDSDCSSSRSTVDADILNAVFVVTDSGSNETDYYHRVLRPMKHPLSGEKAEWTRLADFYRVSERVWATSLRPYGPNAALNRQLAA